MNPKTKFAITLATTSLIFIAGILAILTTYLLKNTINANPLNSKTKILKKFINKNKHKLPKEKMDDKKKGMKDKMDNGNKYLKNTM